MRVQFQVIVNGETVVEKTKDVQDITGAVLELASLARKLSNDLADEHAIQRTHGAEKPPGYATGARGLAESDQVRAAALEAITDPTTSFFLVVTAPDGSSGHSCVIYEDDESIDALTVLHYAREESTRLLKAALRDGGGIDDE